MNNFLQQSGDLHLLYDYVFCNCNAKVSGMVGHGSDSFQEVMHEVAMQTLMVDGYICFLL